LAEDVRKKAEELSVSFGFFTEREFSGKNIFLPWNTSGLTFCVLGENKYLTKKHVKITPSILQQKNAQLIKGTQIPFSLFFEFKMLAKIVDHDQIF
jgi:hypothetical protein